MLPQAAKLLFVSLSLSLSMTGKVCAADGADKLTRIRIGLAARSTTSMPFFVARERGFFREEGLEAELIVMQAIQTIQATLGKSLQFASATGSAVSAAVRGADIKVVLAVTDRPSFDLIVQPNITSVQQLRGKKIGITGLGGTSHVALQIALEAAGENPKNFVYVVLGAPQQLPALETGTVDAAMFSPPFDFYAKKKKFREVLDVGAKVKMPLGGLTTMLSTVRNRPDEVRRVLRSMQLAKQEVLRSKEKATALILKYLQVDKEAAEETFGALKQTVSGSGVPTHEGMDLIMKSLQAAGQFTDRKVAFDEIADDRIAKEVAKELGYKIQ
jgi:ABC-type nitrate/sulfonate/bicarbonate transport system substrate-binding protein